MQSYNENWLLKDQLDQEVILVGNGASLLEKELGPFIDHHDVIVRFNLFKTRNYEKHVGTKTSIWFCNRDAQPVQMQDIIKEHKFREVFVHTWYNTSLAADSIRYELKEQGYTTPVFEVDKGIIGAMRTFLGANYSSFSTGALAVWLLLGQYRKLKLVGFDWWNAPAKFHYADNEKFKHNPASGHQPHLEKSLFDRLIDCGRLSFE